MQTRKLSLKTAGFYTLMFIMIILTCIAVAEYWIEYYYTKNYLPTKFDPVLGWRQVDGSYSIKPMNTFNVYDYYINEFGLRNRDIEKVKHKDTKRIIFLGDSFTFGFAVKNADLFTKQVENLLNGKGPFKYETINAGIPKYSTAQELLLMKELANNGIKGDIYVLMVFTNDILDNLRMSNYLDLSIDHRQPGFILDGDGELILKYPPSETPNSAPKTTTPPALKEVKTASDKDSVRHKQKEERSIKFFNLSIIKFLKERIGILLQTRPALVKSLVNLGFDIELPRMPSLISGWYEDKIIEGVPLMKALIREIQKEAHNNNAELFVVLIPSPIQVNRESYIHILKHSLPDNKSVAQWIKEPARPQVVIGQICKDLDIRYLDLLPVMIENKEKNLYIPGDGHFSKAGHDLTAKSVVNFLNDNDINTLQ